MWKYIRRYLPFAILAGLFMVGEVSMDLLQPEIMSKIVDDGVLGLQNNGVSDLRQIWILGLQMIGFVLIGGLCGSLNNVFVHMSGQNIGNDMRKDCFGKIMNFSFPQMNQFGTGTLVTRVTNDITQVQNLVSQFVRGMIRTSMLTFGSMYCMFRLNARFGQIVLCAFPFLVGTLVICLWKANPLFSTLQGKLDQINAIMYLVVALILLAGSFSVKAGGTTPESIMAAFGGYFSVKGLISVGVISAFIVYAKQFSRPINELAQIYGQMQTAIAGAERVFTVLDEKNEKKSGVEFVQEKDATVSFQNVCFSYDGKNPVIKNFSLTVPAGKKVALVGATGSGKTTIVNLLMRFYDIDSGKIMINNQNLGEIARGSLRKNVAIVLQDTVLFSDTVLNNLKYANAQATQDEVEKAAKMSLCSEMIRHLSDGYDTVLVGAGASISQGQRQLLAIARAFVADPQILILDEATSNVDTRTEKAIQTAMQTIMKGRTSIVIAHRLSTIRDSDQIIVMDHGEIVEQGTHEELLSQKGKYYELYMTQYQGFAT